MKGMSKWLTHPTVLRAGAAARVYGSTASTLGGLVRALKVADDRGEAGLKPKYVYRTWPGSGPYLEGTPVVRPERDLAVYLHGKLTEKEDALSARGTRTLKAMRSDAKAPKRGSEVEDLDKAVTRAMAGQPPTSSTHHSKVRDTMTAILASGNPTQGDVRVRVRVLTGRFAYIGKFGLTQRLTSQRRGHDRFLVTVIIGKTWLDRAARYAFSVNEPTERLKPRGLPPTKARAPREGSDHGQARVESEVTSETLSLQPPF